MINLLIVDDDMHIRELLKYHLNSEGYIVYEARDGEKAIDKVIKNQIWLS